MAYYQTLLDRIAEYKRRFFFSQLLKGGLLFVAVSLTVFLFLNTAEFFGRFASPVRGAFLFSFIALVVAGLWHWVAQPLLGLYGLRRPLTDQQAAMQIGQYFPQVGDRLLNTLQLNQLLQRDGSALLEASLQQRLQQLLFVRFADAVQLGANRRYVRYVLPPVLLALALLLFYPTFFSEGTQRLVYFNQTFTPPAPFRFVLANQSLTAFQHEDFTVRVKLAGQALPDEVYVVSAGVRSKMDRVGGETYQYTFRDVQQNTSFTFDAGGFSSDPYALTLRSRSVLSGGSLALTFPAYLHRKPEVLNSIGDVVVPEGTTIRWRFQAENTNGVWLMFSPGKRVNATLQQAGTFGFTGRFLQSATYAVHHQNAFSADTLGQSYQIRVIPDQHPQVSVQAQADTLTFAFVDMGGVFSDDYGLSKAFLWANIFTDTQKRQSVSLPIATPAGSVAHQLSLRWPLAGLGLKSGDRLEYYVEVYDNDGVHGAKASRSSVFTLSIDRPADLAKDVASSLATSSQQSSKLAQQAAANQDAVKQLADKLKFNKRPDFRLKKDVSSAIDEQQRLLNEIKSLRENLEKAADKAEFLNDKPLSEQLAQMEKLLEELSQSQDAKTLDALKQLMDNVSPDKLSQMLSKVQLDQKVFQQNMTRMAQLMKQLSHTTAMNKSLNELQQQADKLDNLAERELQPSAQPEAFEQEQQQLSEQVDKTLSDMQRQQQRAKTMELATPPVNPQNASDIKKQLQQASESLAKQNPKSAAQQQRSAAQKMRQMKQSMQQQSSDAAGQQQQQNMEDVRYLLENVISLSFNQEKLFQSNKGNAMQDYRMAKSAAEQENLINDATLVVDSLQALARRLPMVQSSLIREVNNTTYAMTESLRSLKEGRSSTAVVRQQSAMTSLNNTALLLNDLMRQMQQSQSSSASASQQQQQQPSLGEMQQQMGQQLQELSQQQRQGQNTSQAMSGLAERQARLNRMLQDALKKAGKEIGKQFGDLPTQLDKQQSELVNKSVGTATLERQRKLVTQLLEFDKAVKEQEQDSKRKANTGVDQQRQVSNLQIRSIPAAFNASSQLNHVQPTLNSFYSGLRLRR